MTAHRPHYPPPTSPTAAAAPLAITIRNCEAATGMSWAAAKRFARARGVPIARVHHRCDAIDGAAFAAALRAAAGETRSTPRPVVRDEYDQILVDCGVLR